MSLREKLLRVAPEAWEDEFVRPPRPDRYDPRRRDAHAGGRAPAPHDGILVLKNGRIAESGSFDELMEKKGFFRPVHRCAGVRAG